MIRKLLFPLLFYSLPAVLFCQKSFKGSLGDIKGFTVKEISNPEFRECYEITVEQQLDHFDRTSPSFKQQLIVGINNIEAPVVMFTEGYALGKISGAEFCKDCNIVYVEHRFFGKSRPDSLNWNFLTIKQAAYDLHHIHKLLSGIFKGRWATSGASKSGQTAIAYKMYFPGDADATIAYATPVKSSVNDERIPEYLNAILNSDCGKKVAAFQKFILRNKAAVYKEFEKYAGERKYTFNKIGSQKAFEYMILEYPFSFFQNCNDCRLIPDTLSPPAKIMDELVAVVPPKFYSDVFVSKLEPSFYMFYHELGYYEYNIESFKQWLPDDNYSNSVFSPRTGIPFDNTYLTDINKFINDPKTKGIIFIYGDLDPYAGARPSLNSKGCMKVMIKNGCHKSRLDALNNEQRKEVYSRLSEWLGWTIRP
jgi:hypothetical protein